jgi:hypothetical protein
MRFSEIYNLTQLDETELSEKQTVPEYGTESYGTWEIKYRNVKKNGKFDAMGMHKRNPNIPRAASDTVEDAIADVKKQIDRYIANDDQVLKYSKGQINLNAEFTRECLEHGPTGIRLSRVGDESILTLCSPEYAELGPEVYGSGEGQFTKLFQRKPGTGDEAGGAATLYLAGITTNKIRQLGLQPNGRYSLQYVGKDPEYGHLVYKLIFDSITAGPTDKQRLHTPGLTLAVS